MQPKFCSSCGSHLKLSAGPMHFNPHSRNIAPTVGSGMNAQKVPLNNVSIDGLDIGYAEINGPHVSIYLHPSSYVDGYEYEEEHGEYPHQHEDEVGESQVIQNAHQMGLHPYPQTKIGVNDEWEGGYIGSYDLSRVEKLPGNWDHLRDELLAGGDLDYTTVEKITHGTAWRPMVSDQ